MESRTLGRTGLKVSLMGMGTGGHDPLGQKSGRPETEMHRLLQRAYELGINYFDTSPGYLDSELIVGRALESLPRDKLIISTKIALAAGDPGQVHVMSGDDVVRSVEPSLRRLQLDEIDLMLDEADEQTWIRRARLLTLLWGAFSFAAALFVLQFGTVITAGIKLGSVITGGLLGMFLLGIFVQRASSVCAVAGSLLGMASVVMVMAASEISWSWYCGIGTVVTFLTGYVTSLLSPVTVRSEGLSYAVLRSSANSKQQET